jgi:hypothetical protein
MIEPEQGRRARTRADRPWPYPHAPRGTCVPECPSYGWCHCGCGGRPTTNIATHPSSCRYKGHPFTFVAGHQARVLDVRAGIWSRNGVAVEKVRPLLFWLRERHGSIRQVALVLGMPEATVRGYVYNRKRKRVPPEAAHRIANTVLSHRRRWGPLDRWEDDIEPSAVRGGRR